MSGLVRTVSKRVSSAARALSPRRSRETEPSLSAPATPRGESGTPGAVPEGVSASAPTTPREGEAGTCLPPVPSAESSSGSGKFTIGLQSATSGKSPSGKSPGIIGSIKAGVGASVGAVSSKLDAVKPSTIAAKAKRTLLTRVQKLVEKKLDSTYTGKVKLSIAADRRTPWPVRIAIHEVVDEVWENIHFEAVRAFEKMIEGEAKEIEDEEENAAAKSPGGSIPPSPPESPPQDEVLPRSDMLSLGLEELGLSSSAILPRLALHYNPPAAAPPTPRRPAPSPPASPPEEDEKGFLQKAGDAMVEGSAALLAATAAEIDDVSKKVASSDVGKGVAKASDAVVSLVDKEAGGTMRVVLVSGTGLKSADKNGLSDPYCMLRFGKIKRQSKTIRKTLDPKWNEEFEFKGDRAKLGTQLDLKLYDWDRIGRDDALGDAKVDLSECLAKPHEMIEFPEVTVEGKDAKGFVTLKATCVCRARSRLLSTRAHVAGAASNTARSFRRRRRLCIRRAGRRVSGRAGLASEPSPALGSRFARQVGAALTDPRRRRP